MASIFSSLNSNLIKKVPLFLLILIYSWNLLKRRLFLFTWNDDHRGISFFQTMFHPFPRTLSKSLLSPVASLFLTGLGFSEFPHPLVHKVFDIGSIMPLTIIAIVDDHPRSLIFDFINHDIFLPGDLRQFFLFKTLFVLKSVDDPDGNVRRRDDLLDTFHSTATGAFHGRFRVDEKHVIVIRNRAVLWMFASAFVLNLQFEQTCQLRHLFHYNGLESL